MDLEIIDSYSRKQALEDGVLADLNKFEVCREHYRDPIACTASVWAIIEKAARRKRRRNGCQEILNDMLWMSRGCKRVIDESTIMFTTLLNVTGLVINYEFKLVRGPDDDGSPCVTIMMPNED